MVRNIKGSRVTVVGLARSGRGAANLLAELGAEVVVTDLKKQDELANVLNELHPSVRHFLGDHPEAIFVDTDMVILSPGVPSDAPPISHARRRGIPVIGELELAYQLAAYGSEDPPIPPVIADKGGFLAVTGTNGKSTTTALLDYMVRKSRFQTILGGNIGNALTGELLEMIKRKHSVDYIIAEVSSFQLETIEGFKPRGAALINITPDHLDRYSTMAAYAEAKAGLFKNQGNGDFLILNYDDPVTMSLYNERIAGKGTSGPGVHFFSRREMVYGIYARNGVVFCNFLEPETLPKNFPLIATDEIRIKGVHNLENAMAASAMALLAGCSIQAVQDSLREFPGLEHRLEFVRELDGVRYYNDSKGTNTGAVVKSLESFSDPIVLIAGGRDKAGDFSQLRELVRTRVKALVLIGEAREKMRLALGDSTDTVMADDMTTAVEVSRKKAGRGDIVLLSPACASFDMFADFEDRGRQFKKIVMELN